MSSSNLYDAKKECDSIPSCLMFFDNPGLGDYFYSCENTASVSPVKGGYNLYQVWSGNQ